MTTGDLRAAACSHAPLRYFLATYKLITVLSGSRNILYRRRKEVDAIDRDQNNTAAFNVFLTEPRCFLLLKYILAKYK